MNNGLHSKHAQYDRLVRASFDNPCAGACFCEMEPNESPVFRFADQDITAI
jgi:hypothetical protein